MKYSYVLQILHPVLCIEYKIYNKLLFLYAQFYKKYFSNYVYNLKNQLSYCKFLMLLIYSYSVIEIRYKMKVGNLNGKNRNKKG